MNKKTSRLLKSRKIHFIKDCATIQNTCPRCEDEGLPCGRNTSSIISDPGNLPPDATTIYSKDILNSFDYTNWILMLSAGTCLRIYATTNLFKKVMVNLLIKTKTITVMQPVESWLCWVIDVKTHLLPLIFTSLTSMLWQQQINSLLNVKSCIALKR